MITPPLEDSLPKVKLLHPDSEAVARMKEKSKANAAVGCDLSVH
jgi:hypothetical protein